MDRVSETLYVVFEDPFWIGVFERVSDGRLTACKVTFGAEPKDYEVYDFILKNHVHLRFSPAVETALKAAKPNPKRMQREVHRQVQDTGIGTKSQQALKLMQEQVRTERRMLGKERREAEKQRQLQREFCLIPEKRAGNDV